MDTNSVKISLEYNANTRSHIAKLHFGNIVTRVPGDARYLTDDFYDGYCGMEVPSEVHKIFAKHDLDRLTDASNGEIMRILRKVFVEGDTSVFQKQTKDRIAKNASPHKYETIKVNVRNDEAIQDLFADDDFIKIIEQKPKTPKKRVKGR
ncbi:MAG: hypothetical protein LBB18_03395 [Puniceicoccales bacterium]|nr:hypothetical protein [Puniceicoccales bacterium]